MLVSCNQGAAQCSATDFFTQYSSIYGICHFFVSGFDSNGFQAPKLRIFRNGMLSGLRLELLLPDARSYYLDHVQGVRIFIGDSNIEDTMYEEVSAPLSTMIMIGLKKTKSKILPWPYSTCIPDTNYKKFDCINTCYNQAVLVKCGCSISKESLCKTTTEIVCELNFYDNYFKELYANYSCALKCTERCDLTFYELSTSFASFPSENYVDTLMRNKEYLFNEMNRSVSEENLKKNSCCRFVYSGRI